MSMIRYFNQRDKVSDRMVDQHMKHLADEYKKANVTIRNQLEVIHRKYSVNGELSYAEMTKYNRLANLQKDVNAELGRISGITTKNTAKLAGDVYNESFFRTAYALEQGAGMDLSFGKLPTKQVEAAITNPYREIALDTHRQRVRNNMRRDITQGIIQGESYPQMAKRVQTSLEQNLNNAERIARTEAHRAREVAALDSMEHAQDMGIQMQKMWVSAVDQRTRDTHAAMDGQRVAVDENFVSPEGATGPAPGELGDAAEVINCRCTSVAVIEGYEPEARRIRGEGIVEYKPYSEYAKEKGWPMKYSGPEPRLEPIPVSAISKTLEKAENEIRDRKTEKAIIIDNDGNVVYQKTGTKNSVRFTQEEVETYFKGNTFTHNHPSGVGFSPDDVKLAQKYGMREMRAVGNKYSYSIKPAGGEWLPKLADANYTSTRTGKNLRLSDHILEKNNQLKAEINPLVQARKITPTEAHFEHYHRMWSELAEETKAFEYVREVL